MPVISVETERCRRTMSSIVNLMLYRKFKVSLGYKETLDQQKQENDGLAIQEQIQNF
jgi:hypothetical protein